LKCQNILKHQNLTYNHIVLKIKNSCTSKVIFFLNANLKKEYVGPKKTKFIKHKNKICKREIYKKSKLKTKKGEKFTYIVFTNAFNFLGFNLASMHAYSQAYFPLLDFFNQGIFECQLGHLLYIHKLILNNFFFL